MNPPATRTSRLFVDAVEGEVARLLLGEEAVTLPLALLPPGTREGDWIDLVAGASQAPPNAGAEADALRRKLSADDPGGDIEL